MKRVDPHRGPSYPGDDMNETADAPKGDAVTTINALRDRYESELNRLEAQQKGVMSKIASLRAKLEACDDTLKALKDAAAGPSKK